MVLTIGFSSDEIDAKLAWEQQRHTLTQLKISEQHGNNLHTYLGTSAVTSTAASSRTAVPALSTTCEVCRFAKSAVRSMLDIC